MDHKAAQADPFATQATGHATSTLITSKPSVTNTGNNVKETTSCGGSGITTCPILSILALGLMGQLGGCIQGRDRS